MARTVFIYGNALDDEVRLARKITTDSPAASRKIFGMACAIQRAGGVPVIESLGRGRVKTPVFSAPKRMAGQGVLVRYLPFVSVPLVSQIVSMISLAWAALRNARNEPDAVHVFYNRLAFYLPALWVLRALGAKRVVDIEDGEIKPPASKPSPGNRSNVPARRFEKLIDGGALLANSQLRRETRLRPTLTYYGVIDGAKPMRRDWRADPFELLMAGSLFPETGADLLVSSLNILRERDGPRIRVNVTGSGPSLRGLRRLNSRSGRLEVVVHDRLELSAYADLLSRMHVGLSLKLVASTLADTTFPSKTVEFAEYGMLLIATDISDVRRLFGDAALYLDRDDPEKLADLIDTAARDRHLAMTKAEKANAELIDRLSPFKQGEELLTFLFEGSS